MSTPVPKRRRLNASAAKLTQPFKSPFKSPFKTPLEPSKPDDLGNCTPQQETSRQSATQTSPSTGTEAPSTPTPGTPSSSSSSSITSIAQLQSTHTRLLHQFSALRATLDAHTQALALQSSSRDAELELLISKWKSASRMAAEEVFAKARDRVNRMGGVGAMRERERNSGWGKWEEEEKKKKDEEDDGRERDGLAGEREGDGPRDEKAEEREKDDDEGYTMDMMLKTLNIELDVIGYDKDMQRWTD